MKKFLLIAAAVLALVACNKDKNVDNSQKPSVTWEANTAFNEMEITTDMDAKVGVHFPEGLASFQITLTKIPVELIGIANKLIGTSGNKGSGTKAPVFDMLNDVTATSALSKMGFLNPSSLKNAISCTLDFNKLVWELASETPLENASKFVFDLALTDSAGNTLTKTVRFNWTSAPEIVSVPEGDIDLNAESPALSMKITAPGKIAKATLTFSNLVGAPSSNEGILAYIKSFTKDGYVVDLIENPSVAKALSLPSGSDVKDKTQLTIDYSTFLFALSIQASSRDVKTLMKVYVEDSLGKSVATDVILLH